MTDNADSHEPTATLKRLSKDTIRRISSDQVVTDLVTALKELIENALDAGATQIQIKLWGHGLTQFTVRDNGTGMTYPDLAIAGRRYYTSKLGLFRHEHGHAAHEHGHAAHEHGHAAHDATEPSAVDSSLDEPVTDLATAMATSYGFRGEALASLIDLADSVSLASRSRDSTGEGWCVVWDRSNKDQLLRETPPSLKAQAHPIGTTVTVRGLFQPTPVRRRVLEAAIEKGTEHRRVVTMLYSYCLIRPQLKLHLSWLDPATRYDLSKNAQSSIGEVLLAVFGPDVHDNLQHVTADEVWRAHCSHVPDHGARLDFALEAYIPRPDADPEVIAKSTPDRMFLFVNGRPVEGTAFGKELTRHFRRQFDQRRKWPLCVLALTLPVDYFDVNLTPNKRAVLIRDEETLASYWRSYLSAAYPTPASPSKSASQTYFTSPVKYVLTPVTGTNRVRAPIAQAAINQGQDQDQGHADDDFAASPLKVAAAEDLPGFQTAAELHRATKRKRDSSDEDEPAAKRAKSSQSEAIDVEVLDEAARPELIVAGPDWLDCHVLGQIPQARGLWAVTVKQTLVVCDVHRLLFAVYYHRLVQTHKLAPRIELKQPLLLTAAALEASDAALDERQLAACLKLLQAPEPEDEQILVLNGIQLYAEDEQVAVVALAEQVQQLTVAELTALLKLMLARKTAADPRTVPVPRLATVAKQFKALAQSKADEDTAHKVDLTREQVKELIVELQGADSGPVRIEAVLTPEHQIVFYTLASLVPHDP